MEERSPSGSSAVPPAADVPSLPASIPQLLLEVLVCPACYGRVELHAAGLKCVACLRTYPVVDGIPVMLIERATPAV